MKRRISFLCGAMGSVVLMVVLAGGSRLWALEGHLSRPKADLGPTPVRVSLYLVDLWEVNGPDQSFQADVVLFAGWEDPRLAEKVSGIRNFGLDQVWHPRLQIANQRGASPSFPQVIEVEPTGRVQYRQRWWGRFSAPMDLREFPLDRQRFSIHVVSVGYPRGDVELIPDEESTRSGRAENLSISDWVLGPARLDVADMELVPGVRGPAGVRLVLEGERQKSYYVVQVVLPLIMIVLMGWVALWVDPSLVPSRLGTVVTTMLTLIAYRFALGTMLPRLPYLTRLDHFILGSTTLIFVLLLFMAACSYLIGNQKLSVLVRLNRWAQIVFPLAFALLVAAVWWP